MFFLHTALCRLGILGAVSMALAGFWPEWARRAAGADDTAPDQCSDDDYRCRFESLMRQAGECDSSATSKADSAAVATTGAGTPGIVGLEAADDPQTGGHQEEHFGDRESPTPASCRFESLMRQAGERDSSATSGADSVSAAAAGAGTPGIVGREAADDPQPGGHHEGHLGDQESPTPASRHPQRRRRRKILSRRWRSPPRRDDTADLDDTPEPGLTWAERFGGGSGRLWGFSSIS